MENTLERARKTAEEFSGLASEVARKLAFAGIAVVWMFKQDAGMKIQLDASLLWALSLFVAALAFDLLQYVGSAAIWATVHRLRELKSHRDPSVAEKPFRRSWNLPAYVLFWSKLALTVAAYGFLFANLAFRFP